VLEKKKGRIGESSLGREKLNSQVRKGDFFYLGRGKSRNKFGNNYCPPEWTSTEKPFGGGAVESGSTGDLVTKGGM